MIGKTGWDSHIYWACKKSEMRGFDEESKHYGRSLKYILGRRIDKFKRFDVKPKNLVLDVGTGSGVDMFALSLLSKEARFIGIDISIMSLSFVKSEAKCRSGFFEVVRADACFLPFRSSIFDLVNTSLIVHHHPLDGVKQVFAEFRRVMRENGILFMDEPCSPDEQYSLFLELHILMTYLWECVEILDEMPKEFKEKLYSVLPIFAFGSEFYPSVVRRLLADVGFKVNVFESIVRRFEPSWMLRNIEQTIGTCADEKIKIFLKNRLRELRRKRETLKECASYHLIVKALK